MRSLLSLAVVVVLVSGVWAERPPQGKNLASHVIVGTVEKITTTEKPFGGDSRIIQPSNSRDSGPEFGPSPRSTGGAPGKRGGWKRR